MAILTSVQEVQQWLEPTKLTLPGIDSELGETMTAKVLGRVSQRYDVSTWTNDSVTPRLVRSVISMLIASAVYRRSYSEVTADTQNTYAEWLETQAELLLQGIVDGTIDLAEVEQPASSGPDFWPTEQTGLTQEVDASGANIGGQFGADRKFAMGMRF